MSARESFFQRSDVQAALEELSARRLRLSAEGHLEEDLPNARDHLVEQGIQIPEDSEIRLIRTVHETDVQPQGPYCGDVQCRPVNCHRVGKHWVCEWSCP